MKRRFDTEVSKMWRRFCYWVDGPGLFILIPVVGLMIGVVVLLATET